MIKNYKDKQPKIHDSVFIADSADIIGDITLEKNSSVWYNAVLRGDVDSIRIGTYTNIQDLAVIHADTNLPSVIGNHVTVGHSAILHSCTIKNNVLIGMGSIILPNVIIHENVIVGAGTLIPPGKEIPSNSMVFGSPGKVIRALTEEEVHKIYEASIHYKELAEDYIVGGDGNETEE